MSKACRSHSLARRTLASSDDSPLEPLNGNRSKLTIARLFLDPNRKMAAPGAGTAAPATGEESVMSVVYRCPQSWFAAQFCWYHPANMPDCALSTASRTGET